MRNRACFFAAAVGVAAALPLAGCSSGPSDSEIDTARKQASESLKRIGAAVHRYSDSKGTLPANITDRGGKPLLSWRVALLPFLEQEALYRQFHLDEPWDSEHNKPLLEQMPAVYKLSRVNGVLTIPKEKGLTYYQGFVGKPGAGPRPVFVDGKPIKITEVTDGTSHTIFATDAAQAVPWTKPEDLPFDPQGPLPKLGGHFPGLYLILLVDGTSAVGKNTMTEKALKAGITINGGEAPSTTLEVD